MTNEALELLYRERIKQPRTICGHMPVLRELASECETVVEFGVRYGCSTVALLLGAKGMVLSYDIESLPQWHAPIKAAAGNKWHLTIGRSEDAQFCEADMLFHDTFHNYSQVKKELDAHADKVRKYLVFHDSVKNAISGGENHTRGNFNLDMAGFRIAVDELMIRDKSWFIKAHYPGDDGLLVLERRP